MAENPFEKLTQKEEKNPWEDEEKILEKIKENDAEYFNVSEEERNSPAALKELEQEAQRDFKEATQKWRMFQPKSPHIAAIEKQKSVVLSLDRDALRCQRAILEESDPEKIEHLKRKLAILDLKNDTQQEILENLATESAYASGQEKPRMRIKAEARKADMSLPPEQPSSAQEEPALSAEEESLMEIAREEKEQQRNKMAEVSEALGKAWSGKGEIPKTQEPPEKSEETPPEQEDEPKRTQEKEEKRREIARSALDAAYQAFDAARGDKKRLQALRHLMEQSLTKYREAVKNKKQPAMPQEELRLMQLQRKIEKALEQWGRTDEERPQSSGEEVPVLPLEEIHEELDIAIDKIEAYYKENGDDRKKIENALNASEYIFRGIQKAGSEGRWKAPEQSKRVQELIRQLRKKLQSL